MVRHLFQRTITRNGKKIKAWYYWYYDENGKQVRKSCGKDGKPCLLKRDAESFISCASSETTFCFCSSIVLLGIVCFTSNVNKKIIFLPQSQSCTRKIT